jgi:Flp pilus assembly protein TadD
VAQEQTSTAASAEVVRLLQLGQQQYENGKYGLAMSTFREVLALDPNNRWAKQGIAASHKARQQQSEQVLQNDHVGQSGQTQSGPRWRRHPN